MTTNDTAKNLAKTMLDSQKQVVDHALAQSKLAEKQLAAAFDASRAGAELSRDLVQSLGQVWLDAVVPAKPAPAAK